MESISPLSFCLPETSAPALNRGLAILAALGQEVPRSLEHLSNELALPKASVFRLLETLTAIGVVRKTENKRYEALWRLTPIGDPQVLFRESIEQKMAGLCEATGCTIEWYEPCAEGMSLILQSNPNSELCVKAQPGFLRAWADEFEAVARLGAAFAPNAPEITETRTYVRNGVMAPLAGDDIQQQLAAARQDQTAFDTVYNANGVRRIATAVFTKDGHFRGVLAVAEVYHFKPGKSAQTFIQQLKTILNS